MTLVRLTFWKKPGRKTRVMARPVWSGPSEKRKQAGTPNFRQSAIRGGTPSRVPRSVSMSILSARRSGIRSVQRVVLVREVVVEGALDRGLEVDLRLPAEALARVRDRGHPLLDILVVLPKIFSRGNLHDLRLPGVL